MLTNTPAEILPTFSFFDGATITPPAHTPFPTPTLDPDPTPTAIPFVVPAQNAEGKIFYFVYDDQGKKALHMLEVDDKSKLKKEPVKVYEDILPDGYGYPSPDAKRLAIVGPWGSGGILHIASRKFEKFPISWGPVYFHNWFPDSKQILYKNENGALMLGDIETEKNSVVFWAEFGTVQASAASPDGRKIVFAYTLRGEWQGIWIMDANGQNVKKLHEGSGLLFSWSPDGSQIASNGMIMNADGTNLHSIVTSLPLDLVQPLCGFASPLWSPDSKHVAIVLVPRNKTDLFCQSGNPLIFQDAALVVVDVITQESYLIPTDQRLGNLDPTWSPDGKQLAFVSSRSGYPDIWVVNIDGTSLEKLTDKNNKIRFLFWQKP